MMKIKVIKKRSKGSKTQNNKQLELTFVESSKKKKKDSTQIQTINSISRIFLSSFILVSFFYIVPILINFTDNNFNTKEYTKGETILIPQGVKHRIENKKNKKVVFIEVQTGTYFGEDDIVRIEDDYNRT